MTEFHAKNMNASIREQDEAFWQAMAAGDWPSAERAWLRMLQIAGIAIKCAVRARIEADAYEAMVLLHEPKRTDRPVAPLISGFAYVYTRMPWTCAAKQFCELINIGDGMGYTYVQEHFVTDTKTICGKKVTYPVTQRFDTPSWPRLHELCPECVKLLVARGVMPLVGDHSQS